MTNIIFDTDIGSDIDDAMALLLAIRHPGVAIRCVTTVYGLADIRARIAKKTLDLAGLDVPVGAGVDEPIQSPRPVWLTGSEGYAALTEEELSLPPEETGIEPDGVGLLIETARKHSGDVDVVAIGPLTNLARALERAPDLARHVRRIYAMMGGITFPEPAPEDPLVPGVEYRARYSHNAQCDIGAARAVLASGIPLTMVGNDVTTRVRIDTERMKRIEALGDELSLMVYRMMEVWLTYRSRAFSRPVTRTCLHDALVVAVAAGEPFVESDRVSVRLEDTGATVVRADPDSHIEVCRTVRAEEFEEWYLRMVTSPAGA